MAQFGRRIKTRLRTGNGTFHIGNLTDRSAIHQRRRMGISRIIFSALSLLFGGGMIYVSMHYIPAFIQPQQVLKFAAGNQGAVKTHRLDRQSGIQQIFGPFIQLFHLDRTYLQAGQKLEVKYDLPVGAHVDVEIVQCERFWVIEVFRCRIISRFNAQTENHSGISSYAFEQAGFYHYSHRVTGLPSGEPYRVIWKRGH